MWVCWALEYLLQAAAVMILALLPMWREKGGTSDYNATAG